MRLILTALLLLALPGAAVAQSDPAEQTMMRTVAAEHDRHIALLERLVNQNSGTLNLAGVRVVGDMVRAEVTVTAIDHAKRRVTLETLASVGKTVVLKGEALVLAPSRKFD